MHLFGRRKEISKIGKKEKRWGQVNGEGLFGDRVHSSRIRHSASATGNTASALLLVWSGPARIGTSWGEEQGETTERVLSGGQRHSPGSLCFGVLCRPLARCTFTESKAWVRSVLSFWAVAYQIPAWRSKGRRCRCSISFIWCRSRVIFRLESGGALACVDIGGGGGGGLGEKVSPAPLVLRHGQAPRRDVQFGLGLF